MWSLDRKGGQEKTSSGFNATARDFARFGRLYLHGGRWNGEQVLGAEWVNGSAKFDPQRAEPEVSTWWGMQHTRYWWHPMHPKQGDFYADGSNGQRIYVDPASNTIIVQLANDSDQDFPFRRIVSYLNGTSWAYPRLIPAQIRLAGATYGADSVRPVFNRLMAARATNPEGYVITASGMRAAGRLLAEDPKTRAAGIEALLLATEYSPSIAAGFADLSDAYLKAGDRTKAAGAIRRALELAPTDGQVMRKAKALGVR
jgi:CubicO group peptidase (beta-lactamase class C family)